MMGVQLIDEARLRKIKKTTILGTVCSYPKFTPVPFSEKSIWDGHPQETNAPYGLAKKMPLVQSQAYRAQYGFNSIFLIPTNLYGPEDNFDLETSHVIPAMIRKFLHAKETGEASVVLWGDGFPTREFLYVGDCADAIVKATKLYEKGDPVNLGSGQELSMKSLAELIQGLVGYEGNIVWDSEKPNEQPRRLVDSSRAHKYFGFKAETDFKTGLKNTIDWYLKTRNE